MKSRHSVSSITTHKIRLSLSALLLAERVSEFHGKAPKLSKTASVTPYERHCVEQMCYQGCSTRCADFRVSKARSRVTQCNSNAFNENSKRIITAAIGTPSLAPHIPPSCASKFQLPRLDRYLMTSRRTSSSGARVTIATDERSLP